MGIPFIFCLYSRYYHESRTHSLKPIEDHTENATIRIADYG